ncbi:MAG: PSP1 domain-containing protein [Bacteroidales bacterium]
MEITESDLIYKNPFFSRGFRSLPQQENPGASYKKSCAKLDVTDWLSDIESPLSDPKKEEFVEIRFKNSRKEFFKALVSLDLEAGDVVAVESSPGHDIGIVTLTGELVSLQMKKKNNKTSAEEIKKVYRRARFSDVEKWISSVGQEDDVMFKSRKFSSGLNLSMKINDVEYQGDGTKAIFYYTAEERVDFRELIRVLADSFGTRIEMRQIGARQEAARLGGIGSCGRELCCSSWLTNFKSVSTNFARNQQLSLNPSKLAGQCGKLKCCLRYENDAYLEALAEFPSDRVVLVSKKGKADFQKADVFKRSLWYSYIDDYSSMMAIPLEKVNKIIAMNKQGIIPPNLEDFAVTTEQKTGLENQEEKDDFYRFDEDLIT